MHIHIHAVILPWCFFACVSKVSFTISKICLTVGMCPSHHPMKSCVTWVTDRKWHDIFQVTVQRSGCEVPHQRVLRSKCGAGLSDPSWAKCVRIEELYLTWLSKNRSFVYAPLHQQPLNYLYSQETQYTFKHICKDFWLSLLFIYVWLWMYE